MKYQHIVKAYFLERPNRFIAYVRIPGVSRREKVHVKNTGRCRELLRPDAVVYLEKSAQPGRKTAYDLVAVEKPLPDPGSTESKNRSAREGEAGQGSGVRLVNMDSQAPNLAAGEWLCAGGLVPAPDLVRPETVWGNSRFDFYMEAEQRKYFVEVKGVTLENDGAVMFPDAPSDRAVKHVEELIRAQEQGYQACILFVIQMSDVRYFTPYRAMHPAFADALCQAAASGVNILAYDCVVTPESMALREPVRVLLDQRAVTVADFTEGLLHYYKENRRSLPWREDPAAYHVWVSEIMLQQTRVEAVKPYYQRFLEALPDVEALAHAPEEKLLKLWEGLGYYSRARNLQKAARIVTERYGGSLPQEKAELLTLPGIGPYTAGAIASIAYGKTAAAVDGNVLRVLSRVFADGRDIGQEGVKKDYEALLEQAMSREHPGEFNQAMMEIGAMVCVPNGQPKCEICPLSRFCQAYQNHTQSAYPVKAPPKARKIENRTVLILRDEKRIAIRKRSARGLLAGMYEFPVLEGHVSPQQVMEDLKEKGIDAVRIRSLESAVHIFTHKEWRMTGFFIQVDELTAYTPPAGWIFVKPEEIREQYPIPSAYAAYMKYLE
ncbi:MAG: A/G-specific adenine glycosylase [Lachnospiraceae bacterium]|nr:A/G-specific adenine glycosylase [Lachnospiraceae bacterium]